MRQKNINKEHIEGYLYEHNLQLKEKDGNKYIRGTIDIATDEACLNVVQVNYIKINEFTKAGKPDTRFAALKSIIDSNNTVVTAGKENATKVKIDTSLGVNDFYTNRNGEETLVSAKRNEGGFINIVNSLGPEDNRNTFEFDMIINGTRMVEADPEANIPEDYLIVKGAVFNWNNAILPVELVVKNKGGIDYFEKLDASPKNPSYTKVWGKIINETIVKTETTEAAFGDPMVREIKRNVKQWVITGTSRPENMYEIGDAETGITLEELQTLVQNREVYLSEVKQRAEEYAKNNAAANAGTSSAPTEAVSAASFNF